MDEVGDLLKYNAVGHLQQTLSVGLKGRGLSMELVIGRIRARLVMLQVMLRGDQMCLPMSEETLPRQRYK